MVVDLHIYLKSKTQKPGLYQEVLKRDNIKPFLIFQMSGKVHGQLYVHTRLQHIMKIVSNFTFNSIKVAAHKERTFSHASYVQLCKAELLLFSELFLKVVCEHFVDVSR